MQAKIVSIEELGEMECIDIEVSNNHLFFANGILTHNSNASPDITNMADSMGVSHAGDLIFSIANSPELEQVGLTRIILMKNRYGSMTPGSFTVGLNKSKMSFYDADLPKDSNPVATPIQIGGMDAKLKQKLQFD